MSAPPLADDPRSLLLRLVDCVNRGDPEGFAACFHPDAVVRFMRVDRTLTGRVEIAEWLAGAIEAFDDFTNSVRGLYGDADGMALEVHAKGNQVRPFRGNPPAGAWQKDELYVYEFRDGLISQTRVY